MTNLFYQNKLFKILFFNLQDFIICVISIYLAYSLRFDILLNIKSIPKIVIIGSPIIFLIVINFSNFYYSLTRYFLSSSTFNLLKYYLIFSFLNAIFIILLNKNADYFFISLSNKYASLIPNSIIVIQPIIFFLLLIINRFLISIIRNNTYELDQNFEKKNRKKIIIYGAGDIGIQTLNFFDKFKQNFKVEYFLDDNQYLQGQYIKNIPIVSLNKLEKKKKN